MDQKRVSLPTEFYSYFKVFHELMAVKIREILLVSSSYDAFILEEDGSLASRIINEYSGLNLSQPPRVTRTSSAYAALEYLNEKKFDLVITMPHLDEMDACALALEIKKLKPELPVILLGHGIRSLLPLRYNRDCSAIDRTFVWSGNSDLLLAIVKNTEDLLNVDFDTRRAKLRVLILVEDSPLYYSTLLPAIYKEIVKQTQAVLELGLNEEHRLLLMRTRPKILLAETYEEAIGLYEKHRDFLFGVISDTRLPIKGKLEDDAGFLLLLKIRNEISDLPLCLLSSDAANREKARKIPAAFLDKNSPNILADIHEFFLRDLGFGDFVFRMPDGREIGRASTLGELEKKVAEIPEESFWYHGTRNHFSRWIMARSEFSLASTLREVNASDFSNVTEAKQFVISQIRTLRKWRQKGVVAQFRSRHFDPEIMDFLRIGQGSLGGKARGLAFMAALLHEEPYIHEKYPDVNIEIPKTLAICTDAFESFVEENHLEQYAKEDFPDEDVRESFLRSKMPEWLSKELEAYLAQVTYPLSIRSSSLLEDAQFQPYAGIYHTYMIPNNHPDPKVRLQHLVTAIKLVYASTYYEGPKAYSRSITSQPQEEAMGVIVQQLVGEQFGDFFYPSLSGVAQSHNFYPVPPMKPEEGIAHIAIGLGKTVVEGEKALRFSPKYPNIMPQFSTIDDILENAQRFFYALRTKNYPEELNYSRDSNLERREIREAEEEPVIRMLASTYVPEEHRLRDSADLPGPKVVTFAPILKYGIFPLPEILSDLLELGRKAMGCPIEIEFSVGLSTEGNHKGDFFFLQLRPMVADVERFEVRIRNEDINRALCYSTQALGHGENTAIADIVYVKPQEFKPEATLQIAAEIGRINAVLVKEKRPYLLVGPGRWGTADRWLGIPVQWKDISGAGAIIELRNEKLNADSSQGSHFFLNITSLGLHYLTITEDEISKDFFDWQWVDGLPALHKTTFLRHVRLEKPLLLKVDSKTSQGVIVKS